MQAMELFDSVKLFRLLHKETNLKQFDIKFRRCVVPYGDAVRAESQDEIVLLE